LKKQVFDRTHTNPRHILYKTHIELENLQKTKKQGIHSRTVKRMKARVKTAGTGKKRQRHGKIPNDDNHLVRTSARNDTTAASLLAFFVSE
jgi:hypothetical protein